MLFKINAHRLKVYYFNAQQYFPFRTKDNSSNKCEDIPIRTNNKSENLLPALHNFSISPRSLHHSLFRLLRRCDQCASSRIRYYSSAHPHCRFFQAAFGPVVLQGLCDWLKEHPLVFSHESSAHRKEPSPFTGPLITSSTKSPPPQIMIIPLDNNTKAPESIENLTLISVLEKDEVVNATKTSIEAIPESEIENIHLEPSIQPTHPRESAHSIPLNDSLKAVPDFSDVVLPSADTINHLPKRPILVVSEGTNISTDKSIPDMEVIPPDNDPPPTTVEAVPAETEEEQLKFDSVVLADDLSLAEDLSLLRVVPTEVVPSVRIETEGRQIEPVPASTAGQKESVFMRMSNRIKALELNMSLSSQYLQELSQRYRRQMEDMQRAFNRTIGTLNDTARKAAERVNMNFLFFDVKFLN